MIVPATLNFLNLYPSECLRRQQSNCYIPTGERCSYFNEFYKAVFETTIGASKQWPFKPLIATGYS